MRARVRTDTDAQSTSLAWFWAGQAGVYGGLQFMMNEGVWAVRAGAVYCAVCELWFGWKSMRWSRNGQQDYKGSRK